MEGDRFRHTAQFVRWRPDRDPASCTYDQLERPVRFDLADVLSVGPLTRYSAMRLPCSSQCSATFFAGLHPRRLARHLRVVGRPVQLAARQRLPEVEQRLEREGDVVHVGPRIARSREVLRDGVQVEVARVVDLARAGPTSSACSTGAPGRARRLHALAMVRSRVFWL